MKKNNCMKKIFLSACLLSAIFAGAQNKEGKAAIVEGTTLKEGKVVYERVSQLQFRTNNPEMANMVPTQRKDNFELLFGKNQSLWQNLPNPEGEGNNVIASGGGNMVFRMANVNEVIHSNFETKKRVEQRDMFDREFLVEDTLMELNWKLHDDTKMILNHPARKATAQRITTSTRTSMENGEMKRQEVSDTFQVVAWYATDIPVGAGPREYQGQLPGLILEIDENRGRTVYTVKEISPKVNLSQIKEPKGGKRMSQKEFIAERNKLVEEMQKNMPAGGRMRINAN